MLKYCFILCSLLASAMAFAQTVSTVSAGNFSDGLGMDNEGTVYGSDWGGHTVYKYATDGSVDTFKTGFSNPNGIAVNSSNEIVICDHTAGIVYKYDQAGNEIANYDSLDSPAGIVLIPGTSDFLFVSYNGNTIQQLAADGTITDLYANNGSGSDTLNGPAGITFIGNTPYIANFNDRKIFKFENGSLTLIAQLAPSGLSWNFIGILTAYQGQLFATQIGEHHIYRIDPADGSITDFAGISVGNADGAIQVARFSRPNGILADESNNRLFVSDATPRNLRIIDDVVLSTGPKPDPAIAFELFPNPVSEFLEIKTNSNFEGQLQLLSNDGRLLQLITPERQKVKLDVSQLPAGIYHVQGNNGYTLKFIKH